MDKKKRLLELARDFLEAWNTQDVEKVVATYTPDVKYRDPNTKGFVEGSDAMRKYSLSVGTCTGRSGSCIHLMGLMGRQCCGTLR
jgi:ketosteroid isomerase-like protein